jgi:hypothetical protein
MVMSPWKGRWRWSSTSRISPSAWWSARDLSRGTGELHSRRTVPNRTVISTIAEFPEIDESMDINRLRTLMERSVRNIKDLVESEVPR